MVLKHPFEEQPGSSIRSQWATSPKMMFESHSEGRVSKQNKQTNKQTIETKEPNNLYTLTLGISLEKSLLDRVGHTATAAFHQAGNGSIAGRQKDIRHRKVWFELKVQQGIGFRTSTIITRSWILTLPKARLIRKKKLQKSYIGLEKVAWNMKPCLILAQRQYVNFGSNNSYTVSVGL